MSILKIVSAVITTALGWFIYLLTIPKKKDIKTTFELGAILAAGVAENGAEKINEIDKTTTAKINSNTSGNIGSLIDSANERDSQDP